MKTMWLTAVLILVASEALAQQSLKGYAGRIQRGAMREPTPAEIAEEKSRLEKEDLAAVIDCPEKTPFSVFTVQDKKAQAKPVRVSPVRVWLEMKDGGKVVMVKRDSLQRVEQIRVAYIERLAVAKAKTKGAKK